MPTELSVEVLPSELAQIVESVFGTMLSLDVSQCEASWFPSEDRLTSSIHLTGDWSGAVLLECSEQQACRFAGRFLAMDPPDAVDDVVRDVLGEMANMIGGNLKCILSPGIQLSMPSVIIGSDYSLRVCGSNVREGLAFQSAEGIFWITLLTMQPRQSAARISANATKPPPPAVD
jgi:chemotaxis protein CheX